MNQDAKSPEEQFDERFPNDQACIDHLVRTRWPKGIICSKCAGQKFWKRKRRFLHQCQNCGFELSPTAGTIFHDTHMPIRHWFWVAYQLVAINVRLSPKHVTVALDCNYKSAMEMLACLRRAMAAAPKSKLVGLVLVGSIPQSALFSRKDYRRAVKKGAEFVVYGALELTHLTNETGEIVLKNGRLRLALDGRISDQTIQKFLSAHLEPGTRVRTLSWRGYNLGKWVRQVPPTGSRILEKLFAALKDWLIGAHRKFEPLRLSRYMDEFTFRADHRDRLTMETFDTLLRQAIITRR